VTLQKSFSHPSLVIYLFPTPPIKLKLKIGGRLLIATHLDQSYYLANQQQKLTPLCLLPASASCGTLLGHILSTGGAAPRHANFTPHSCTKI
jgi:hypothetical protein